MRTLHTPTVFSFTNIIISYTNRVVKCLLGSCAAVTRRVQPPADTLDSLWVAKASVAPLRFFTGNYVVCVCLADMVK